MMRFGLLQKAAMALLMFAVKGDLLAAIPSREQEPQSARITVHAGKQGCGIELDSVQVGKTDAQGDRILPEVEPGGHYIHIHCLDQDEKVYFVSPGAGDSLAIQHTAGAPEAGAPPQGTQEAFETRKRLRELVQQAVRLRARGRFEEAVTHLREASRLDPENSDLHRELGITFLLNKDWKRGRVEMLEAIRHQPDDADAHNGLGYALEKLGKLEAALNEYRIATRLEPDDATYRQHYLEAIGKLAGQKAAKKP